MLNKQPKVNDKICPSNVNIENEDFDNDFARNSTQ